MRKFLGAVLDDNDRLQKFADGFAYCVGFFGLVFVIWLVYAGETGRLH